MNKTSITLAAPLAALCALAGGLIHPAHATHRCEDYGLKPVGLYVDGQPAEGFVARFRSAEKEAEEVERDLDQFIKSLGIDLGVEKTAALVGQINSDPAGSYDVPPALQGPGGFATIQLLQRLIFIDDQGNPVTKGGQPIAEKVLYGKFRDYIFIEGPEGEGRGHLSVDTCTDDRLTGRREFYHWDIEVEKEEAPKVGFAVTLRNDNDLQKPFGDLQLPDAALDPNNSHSIWARGLDHKLGVNGTSIKVKNVYHRVLSASDSPLTRLDGTHHYEITEHSCIDLFTRGRPPATVGELLGNDYCLGRCASPAIYNSGD